MSTRQFLPLTLVKPGARDPAALLAEIRRLYFKTTKKTIEDDLAHAIALLKALPDEETRERATVYMEGLAELRKEWRRAPARPTKRGKRP